MEGLTEFDVAEYLKTPEEMSAYLNEYLQDPACDFATFMSALDDVTRAISKRKLAAKAGVSKSAVYVMLSKEGNPSFKTLWQILEAVGIRIKTEPTGLVHSANGSAL